MAKKQKEKLFEEVQFQDVERAKREVTLAKINQIRILIGFIIWWFFGKHKEAAGTSTIVNDEQTATIVVNGGYSPSTVILK